MAVVSHSSLTVEEVDPPLDEGLMETAQDRRWDEVTAELGEIGGQINSLFGRVTEIAAQVDAEDLLAGTGVRSLSQFLAWQLGVSTGRARELAKIASRRGDLPEVTATLDGGLLSVDQVAPIAARLPGDPGADRHFAELAPNLTAGQVRKAVAATIAPDLAPTSDDDTNGDPVSERELRECSFGFGDDGIFHAMVRAGRVDGALIEAGLQAHYDALWQEHKQLLSELGEGVEAPAAPTLFDAYLRMVDRSLEREATDRPHCQRTKVVVHVRVGQDLAQLHLGPALTAAERALLCCDATAMTVLEDEFGVPVSVGREHRIVPDKTRLLVEQRDQGCPIPGCGVTHKLVVHHIEFWEDGGPTDTWNLICLCPHHHRAVHRGELTITGNADEPGGLEIRDTSPKKRRITGRSAARTPTGPPQAAPNTYPGAWPTISWRDWIPPHITTAA